MRLDNHVLGRVFRGLGITARLTALEEQRRGLGALPEGELSAQQVAELVFDQRDGSGNGPSKQRQHAPFIATDGVPSAEEMNSVLKFAIKLFLNRPSTEADQKRYIDGFLKSNCELAKRDVALGGMLTTIMISPEFLYRMELGLGEKLPDGRRMLAPREIAYALSFSLYDYVEKKTLQAADDRRLATKEDVAREFRRMLSEPDRGVRGAVGKHLWVTGKGAGITNARLLEASYPRLLRFFREYFGYLKVNDVFKDDTRHDGRHDAFARVQEVDWFVLNILRDDKHVLNRLLTDDWYFAALRKNSRKTYQAPVYNIDEDREWPIHPEGFKLATVKMPDGQRAGMLTHPTWLAAHSGNFKNDPVRRGKWIQEHLLAGIVPDIPIVVAAQLPGEPHRTLRQRFDVVSKEECWRCHKKMNPLGNPFEAYDDFGRFRTHHLTDQDRHVDRHGIRSLFQNPQSHVA